jgi:hypothetical protein
MTFSPRIGVSPQPFLMLISGKKFNSPWGCHVSDSAFHASPAFAFSYSWEHSTYASQTHSGYYVYQEKPVMMYRSEYFIIFT